MEQKAYEDQELRLYVKQVEEITKAPLSDRKEAAKEWFEAMRDTPKTVAERVRWLLAGSYGYGSYVKARQVATSRNMNRVAALANMTAELEWQCPSRMASQEWGKLTPAQQQAVNNAVAHVIQDWGEEEGMKPAPVRGVSGHVKAPRRKSSPPRLSR